MEFLKTDEIVIKNDYCDIFPNQVYMEEVSLTKTMDENKNLQT
jgi:hypothetical protein